MQSSFWSLVWVASLVGAVGAACGGGPDLMNPQVPTASAQPSGSTVPSVTPSASTTGTAPTPSASASVTAPAFAGPMKPTMKSQMLTDLQAIGIDTKNIPTMAKLEPDKLRKVMKLFTKALGVQCGDCHAMKSDSPDMSAPTPMKKAAKKMWDELVVKLQMTDGSPVFCDSCHQGRTLQLDRTDKKALSKWMGTNFVDPLKRKDKKDHECSTCHGEDMEMHFIALWKAGK